MFLKTPIFPGWCRSQISQRDQQSQVLGIHCVPIPFAVTLEADYVHPLPLFVFTCKSQNISPVQTKMNMNHMIAFPLYRIVQLSVKSNQGLTCNCCDAERHMAHGLARKVLQFWCSGLFTPSVQTIVFDLVQGNLLHLCLKHPEADVVPNLFLFVWLFLEKVVRTIWSEQHCVNDSVAVRSLKNTEIWKRQSPNCKFLAVVLLWVKTLILHTGGKTD